MGIANEDLSQIRNALFRQESFNNRTLAALQNWVLFDTSGYEDIFAFAEQLVMAALDEIETTETEVTWTRNDLASQWGIDSSSIRMAHLRHILKGASRLSLHDNTDGLWSIYVGVHLLDAKRPTMEELFVPRPKRNELTRAPWPPASFFGNAASPFPRRRRAPGPAASRTTEAPDTTDSRKKVPTTPVEIYDGWKPVMQIGGGGQGTAWLAEHNRIHEPGVLKRPTASAEERDYVRLRREAEHLADLKGKSPFIVRLLSCSAPSDPTPWLVTEYAPFGSVQDNIDIYKGDLWRTLRLARDISHALTTTHAAHRTHRDVKPGNLLLFTPDLVKLADFGLAHAPEKVSVTTRRPVQSAWFSPPECESTDAPTPAFDVYMLGRVIYNLLTGGARYSGEYPEGDSALEEVLGRPDLRRVSDLIRLMVPYRVEKRVQSMDAVRAELDWVLPIAGSSQHLLVPRAATALRQPNLVSEGAPLIGPPIPAAIRRLQRIPVSQHDNVRIRAGLFGGFDRVSPDALFEGKYCGVDSADEKVTLLITTNTPSEVRVPLECVEDCELLSDGWTITIDGSFSQHGSTKRWEFHKRRA